MTTIAHLRFASKMDASRNRDSKGHAATLERAKDIFRSVGGEIKQIHFVFGEYDMVAVAEAPSDEAMGKAVLMITSAGMASLRTLKAFPEAEGIAIIKGLP